MAAATIWAAVILATGSIAAVFLNHWLKNKKGKQRGFETLETELQLHKTRWNGVYGDPDGQQHEGLVEFKQYGSRVIGTAKEGGRTWRLEGVATRRRLCYLYVDDNVNVLSVGTSILEMNPAGDEMAGRWMGWSPDGERFTPNTLTLTKLDN